MTPEHFMRQTGIPVLPFMEIDLTGPADKADAPPTQTYIARLEAIFRIAQALKEAQNKPRWEQLTLKRQLYASLEP